MLLPRFLVLEVVLLIHFPPFNQACKPSSSKEEEENKGQKSRLTCTLPAEKYDSLRWMPLLYSRLKGQLLLPEELKKAAAGWSYLIKAEDSVTLSCPGSSLEINNNLVETPLVCLPNGKYGLGDNNSNLQVDSKGLSCSKSIREVIRPSNKHCGPRDNDAKLHQVGFEVNDGTFEAVYEVCHDANDENTWYTNHTIVGKAIKARQGGPRPSNFKEGQKQGFYTMSSAKSMYKVKKQSHTFDKYVSGPAEKQQVSSHRSLCCLW